jgi:hypothetical protein
VLQLGTNFMKNIIYIFVDIIPLVVCMKDIYFLPSLCLYYSFEVIEMLKKFRILSKKINPSIA